MPRLLPILFCVLHWIIAPQGGAQELDPLLAPHAARYTAEVNDLRKTLKAQVTAHEAEYANKLDAVILSATDQATVAALRKEREGVVNGLLATGKTTPLPEEAVAARKAFLTGAAKATFDFNAAKKKVDDAYLKTLAGLAKQAKGKSAPAGLSAQIAAEKRRVAKGE